MTVVFLNKEQAVKQGQNTVGFRSIVDYSSQLYLFCLQGVRFKMNFSKRFIFSISSILLSSCANVSYHLGSVAGLTEEPIFNPNNTYTYYHKAVSNILEFDEFEIKVTPHNAVKTNGHFELFFIPVTQQGSNIGSVGKTPFQISIIVKGKLNTTRFIPFKSILNDDIGVQLVKW
jgi:hypothetical protein